MSKVVILFSAHSKVETCYIILGDTATNDSTISWWMDFLQGAGVREGKEELQAIATRLWLADLDQSILGELTREWLSAEDLKLSLGQQMKILRHVPTYRRSQRITMTPITLIKIQHAWKKIVEKKKAKASMNEDEAKAEQGNGSGVGRKIRKAADAVAVDTIENHCCVELKRKRATNFF